MRVKSFKLHSSGRGTAKKSGLRPLYRLKIEGFKMVLWPSGDLLQLNTELIVKSSRRLSYASSFSKVTGCQAIVATGQNSPWFQSFETPVERQSVFKGAHYWKSEAGVWAESNTEARKKGYESLGSWYRSTPIKDEFGNVTDVVSENLGSQYIAL